MPQSNCGGCLKRRGWELATLQTADPFASLGSSNAGHLSVYELASNVQCLRIARGGIAVEQHQRASKLLYAQCVSGGGIRVSPSVPKRHRNDAQRADK